MRRVSRLLPALVFSGVMLPAFGQQAAFSLRVTQGTNVFQVANGQTLNFLSGGSGQSSKLTLTGTYSGATTATISAPPQLLGASDFTVSTFATPVTLKPGQSFSVDITYTPAMASASAGQLLIDYVQASATAGQPGTAGLITLNLSGTAPAFSVNYVLPPNNNVAAVGDGETISFPATLINSSATATFAIANRGSGAGVVNSIAIAGAAFQLQGVGILPAGVQSGASLTFTVRYTPMKAGSDTGVLTLGIASQTITINLAGSAVSALTTYQVIDGETVTPVLNGQQITVPDTPVGVLRSVSIQVQNTGTAPATINSVSSTGAGFTVTDLPLLPITLQPGGSFTFTVNLTPSQAGPVTGTLTIGPDRFRLAGNGIGAQFSYSYSVGANGNQVTVIPGGTLLFTSATLGQSSSVVFTVTNSGTLAATLTSVGIGGAAAAAFSVTSQNPLPVTIQPKASFNLTVTFTPSVPGLNTATVLVNGQSFVLSAFASGVPALQSYRFTGVSGQVQPFTQPSIGLAINQPYPLALAGTLALTVTSNVFATDPAVQFATGGRTVAFTIAPGSTQAVFPNGSTQLPMQTGTVAETINIVPSFVTQGGATVTPVAASPLVLTVPRAAPQLLSTALQTFTMTGFTVNVTGYSTNRNLSKINLQFSGDSGLSLSQSSVPVDISQSAGFYFSSAGSQQFGGFFSINIPITVTKKSGGSLSTLMGRFTVAATAVNDAGTSNSVTGQ